MEEVLGTLDPPGQEVLFPVTTNVIAMTGEI
jgi:hypothetical protein